MRTGLNLFFYSVVYTLVGLILFKIVLKQVSRFMSELPRWVEFVPFIIVGCGVIGCHIGLLLCCKAPEKKERQLIMIACALLVMQLAFWLISIFFIGPGGLVIAGSTAAMVSQGFGVIITLFFFGFCIAVGRNIGSRKLVDAVKGCRFAYFVMIQVAIATVVFVVVIESIPNESNSHWQESARSQMRVLFWFASLLAIFVAGKLMIAIKTAVDELKTT